MTKWEYFRYTTPTPYRDSVGLDIRVYGEQGWELVSVVADTYNNFSFFFKRQLIENPDQEAAQDEEEKEQYCTDCGNTDLAYIDRYAYGEGWRCKECGKVFIQ